MGDGGRRTSGNLGRLYTTADCLLGKLWRNLRLGFCAGRNSRIARSVVLLPADPTDSARRDGLRGGGVGCAKECLNDPRRFDLDVA
ncbi:hypothetical protein O181_009618 [Austropuccinia psidii MF-1]|uniref:Uncharacterized protein n=1 Tax=Austropuccinia psidii MF-1 TaxID=1389203 RepID=A0A9Q3BRP3_9BASI|nr:hypothetical protein [Austropuccinia psidii MF-1]